jgi:hypothetical protein
MSLGRCVLVPVANPASVGPLLELATTLCDADGGHVVPLTVLPADAEEGAVAEAEQGLRQADAVVRGLGVESRGRLVRAPSPAEGVLAATREHRASLVVMGWRGGSSTTNVFGKMIDSIVGRSSAPLAIVRLGSAAWTRVLLPVSPDHLLPGGGRGLGLAAALAARLGGAAREPTTVLRTGRREVTLPDEVLRLGDRVHHDPRRIHSAVAAAARPEDAIVAAVAPTVSGLRAATTHLAWAAPEATLIVAVDPGPAEAGLEEAVDAAGAPAPQRAPRPVQRVRIAVGAAGASDHDLDADHLRQVLASVGRSERDAALEATTPDVVRATVTVMATSTNRALAMVMEALHDAPELRGAEITYEVERSSSAVAVVHEDLEVRTVPRGGFEALRARPDDDAERRPGQGVDGPHSLL